MKIYDILDKKRLGKELTKEEIEFFVNGVTNGTWQNYETTAMLMAIAINGMTKQETLNLTLSMLHSGDEVDLSVIDGICVDKHSSGGVSDTTSLGVIPIVANCGLKSAKMSGRGLGFTGGTLDKLEAIDGFRTALTEEEFVNTVNTCGASIISQTKNIAPADKILYALRDQTATIASIPLIASSIMSKKLASGAKIILLDVKYGLGAFMKTKHDAIKLAKAMVEIGKGAGRKVCAVITNMNLPLGNSVGCALEVMDAIEVLNGKENNLSYLIKFFSAKLTNLALNIPMNECYKKVNEVIANKSGLNTLAQMTKMQGGNPDQVLECKFKIAPVKYELIAEQDGYIADIDALKISEIVANLGGARFELGQSIDHSVGVRIEKHYGAKVTKGDVIAVMYANTEEDSKNQIELLKDSFTLSQKAPKKLKLIAKIIE